jgi:hypothetical protein
MDGGGMKPLEWRRRMSTYTWTHTANHFEETTHTFCSPCAFATFVALGIQSTRHTDYEFDESCARCGALIPRS